LTGIFVTAISFFIFLILIFCYVIEEKEMRIDWKLTSMGEEIIYEPGLVHVRL
jgi:hypothetical protein